MVLGCLEEPLWRRLIRAIDFRGACKKPPSVRLARQRCKIAGGAPTKQSYALILPSWRLGFQLRDSCCESLSNEKIPTIVAFRQLRYPTEAQSMTCQRWAFASPEESKEGDRRGRLTHRVTFSPSPPSAAAFAPQAQFWRTERCRPPHILDPTIRHATRAGKGADERGLGRELLPLRYPCAVYRAVGDTRPTSSPIATGSAGQRRGSPCPSHNQ